MTASSDSDDFFDQSKRKRPPAASARSQPVVSPPAPVALSDSDGSDGESGSAPPAKGRRRGKPKSGKRSSPSADHLAFSAKNQTSVAVLLSSDDDDESETESPRKKAKTSRTAKPTVVEDDEDDFDALFPKPNLERLVAEELPAPSPVNAKGSSTATVIDVGDNSSVEDVDLVEVDRDVITSARNRSARPPDEPSRPIELKVFYTVWDSDLPPRALVFQVESRKTLADYSEDIVAAFQLPDRSQVRFLHSRIRVFESTKLDAIADLARKKRSAGELPASSLLDDAKPSSIKLEMMTVGDYEKLLHYQKSQQEKVLAPQTVEISEDEVEEEEEPEQQERDVKLVVRFQEADGRGFEFKMKVSEHKTVGELISIVTAHKELSGHFGLRTDDGETHDKDRTAGDLLDHVFEELDEEEQRMVVRDGLVVDLYRRK